MKTTVLVGDAEMFHFDCVDEDAREEMDEIEINEDWDDFPGDGYCDDGTPHSCGACLGYLVEDTRATESILARDILNLTVEARDQAATSTASTLAHIASKHDTQPDIVRMMAQAIFDLAKEPERYHAETAHEAMRLTREWAEMFATRAIVHVVETTDDEWTYEDAQPDGHGGKDGYNISDSRGYGAEGFEDHPCAACSCKVGSYALTNGYEYWCPVCWVED